MIDYKRTENPWSEGPEADAIIDVEKATFFERYPLIKRSEPIKELDLRLKREYAEAILRGEKRVEFRSYTKFYMDRLYDEHLFEILSDIPDEDMEDFLDFARPLRQVFAIHFHDRNNSWYLDVECIDNWIVVADDYGAEGLVEQYDCHELDSLVAELNAEKAQDRPVFFYFGLGKVIDTNLTVGKQ